MTRCFAWLLLGAALLAAGACESRRSAPTSDAAEERPDPDLQGPDLFAEVTASSGVRFTYRNGEETSPHLAILESLGGGIALIDYDGDGLLDIFIPGGGYYDGPDKKQIKGHGCKLFKNMGGFKFKDVTREVGLDCLAGGKPWFYSHAAAVADYDRDGWPDLLVTGWGRVALFHNVPVDPKDPTKGRRFEDVSAQAGLDKGITWATSAAWADFDGDGWPDLYICQYVDWSFANHPSCNYDGKTPDVCPPKRFKGLPHKVFRNNANGTFTDVSQEAGLLPGGSHSSKGLGVLAVDVNLDNKPDVYVANDTVGNFLYINRSTPGKIRFKEVGLLAGVARDGHGGTNGSMGVDAGDPDGSGLPWVWVTNYENELHALYRNMCTKDHLHFLYYTPASGIAAIGQKHVGWGTGFLDVDHHGWEDLFIANGHAIRFPTTTTRRQLPVLLRNRNGKFKEITPRGGDYFRQSHLARGVALGDLDNDGKIDLVVSHMNEPVALLRNVAREDHHWLGVQLKRAGHADVVGARVILEAGGRKQTRFGKGGGSYASSPDRRLIFGLGQTDRIDRLTVIWPDGKQQAWTALALDRYHVLTQGEQQAQELRGKTGN
jgi:hypothetical protein